MTTGIELFTRESPLIGLQGYEDAAGDLQAIGFYKYSCFEEAKEEFKYNQTIVVVYVETDKSTNVTEEGSSNTGAIVGIFGSVGAVGTGLILTFLILIVTGCVLVVIAFATFGTIYGFKKGERTIYNKG